MLDPREFWKKAADYPTDKEAYYPEHASVQEFDQHSGKRVLEYGCGGGSDTLSYLRRGNIVHFVDIAPENVAVTQERMAGFPATGVVLEDSAPLPFPDESFDLVNAHGVLHHIPDPLPVARELWRVLKIGGLAYAMLYTECYWAAWAKSKVPTFGEFTDQGLCYSRAYTKFEGYALFLDGAGFSDVGSVVYNGGMFRTFKAIR